MGKLDETGNFITLYKHWVGTSEVPNQYHLWACLSLVAACVADRVWLPKFAGKVVPNLYTVLLGPSGLGKGVAIDLATGFVKDIPLVNMYRGKASFAHILDHLGRKQKLRSGQVVLVNPKMYLVTPELGMSVGSGPLADEMVKMMTELYTGGEYTFQYGTRSRGNVEVRNQCMNWLGGSTKEWFIASLTRDAIEGGALARMVLIPGKYDFDLRIVEPIIPADAAEVKEHLELRVQMLLQMEGEFVKTPEARALEHQWYRDRTPPSDEGLHPTYKRQHDLLLKLSMLYSLADGRDLVICERHIKAAKQSLIQTELAVPEIVSLSSIPPEHSGFVSVREFIKKVRRVQRSTLTTRCAKRGIQARRLDEFIKTLKAEGVIKQSRGPNGATFYEWKGRGKMAPPDDTGDME